MIVLLKYYFGKKVVLYFYLKDDIFVCIMEVIDFSVLKVEFEKVGVVVVGVLLDLVKKYGKFVVKYNFIVVFGFDELIEML